MEDKYKKLKEKLLDNSTSGFKDIDEKVKDKIFAFVEEYMSFLNKSKTEREFNKNAIKKLKASGFTNIETRKTLKKGDKVYFDNRGKALYAAIIGSDIYNGLNIVGSHIDSPRLDLKPNPLFEQDGIAYLKTQYYGGIKKYQWTTIPLELRGRISLTSGKDIDISIGSKKDDPVFTISDLLPHLGAKQMAKKASEVVEGENLNIIAGHIPLGDSVKLNLLNLLYEKYGMKEKDFTSAEFEFVPLFEARSLGFDKSMVAAYGQDDKVCSYASLEAFLNTKNSNKTAVMILADKEEIGSVGNTSMESASFDLFIELILEKQGINKIAALRKVYANSKMLSADVDGAYDPIYAGYYEKNNSANMSHGLSLCKYTGGRGKGGASDANAEFVRDVRKVFEEKNIAYQIKALGKIDEGGGGTIAYILANKGVDVIDCGVPVLSMHSPYEVASKFDIYEAYRGYKAFYESDIK